MKKLLCIVLAVLTFAVCTGCSQNAGTASTEDEITAYESAVKESAVKKTGEAVWTISYVYDEEGLPVKEIITDAEGTVVNSYFIYSKENLLTSEVHNNPDETKDKYRHTYKDGLLIKTVHTEPSNSKNTCIYTHNEDGTIAGYTLTFASKEVQEAVYSYNALGAVEKIEKTGFEPSVTVYEYNKYGDVVTETITIDGSETVTTYEYTYQQ